MDGTHDLGGMQGFGPVVTDGPGEPPFHEPWEGRVHGLMLSLLFSGGLRGSLRHAIERMGAVDYLETSYYEHWLATLERMVAAKGLTDPEALKERKEQWADAYRHTPHGKPVELRKSEDK